MKRDPPDSIHITQIALLLGQAAKMLGGLFFAQAAVDVRTSPVRRVDVAFHVHRIGGSIKRDPPYSIHVAQVALLLGQAADMFGRPLFAQAAVDARHILQSVEWTSFFTSTALVDR
jgi:hypothetical protein